MVAGFLFCLFVYVGFVFFFLIENQFYMFQALKGKQNLGVFRAVVKQLAGYQRLASYQCKAQAGSRKKSQAPSLPPGGLCSCAYMTTVCGRILLLKNLNVHRFEHPFVFYKSLFFAHSPFLLF